MVDILKGMAQNPVGDVSKLLKQMQGIVGYLQHIENGVMTLSHEVQAQSLVLQMILKILVDKNICTTEEVEEYHTAHVFKPLKAAAEELKAKMEAAEKEAKKQIEAEEAKSNIIIPGKTEPKYRDASKVAVSDIEEVTATTKEVSNIVSSDEVVLTSERSNVVRFPDDKKDS